VFGTTRSKEKALALRAAGIEPVIVDVFDAAELIRVVGAARPQIVIHQLTDLPRQLTGDRSAETLARNARVRSEGARNLVAAALRAGARRLIAQSIAWAYVAGRQPYFEDDPLDIRAEGTRAITVRGVAELERLTTGSLPLEGVVLRYGQLYGPNTGRDERAGSAPVHVDAAAHAAALAIDRDCSGMLNIAEDTGFVSVAKARRELGWDPAFRLDV
jgi:nucleoside-diphosphate-sugar epimerase